jgi:ribosomal protein L40E
MMALELALGNRMICPKCNTELPDVAKFCMECGEPQTRAAAKTARWETCEIVCTQLPAASKGGREWEFRAEATGPRGKFTASASYVSTVNPHLSQESMTKDKSNYVRHVLSSLMRALVQDGWEPLDLLGAHWYSYRFRRRLPSEEGRAPFTSAAAPQT